MPRVQGRTGAAMYRMYGMPRVQGRTGAAMYRMYGMPRVQGRTGAAMYRKYKCRERPWMAVAVRDQNELASSGST